MNEQAVGEAIRKSGISRDELFVTTKLWVQDTGYEATKSAIEKSLKRLNLEYLDLYLIHQPFGNVHGSWRAMQELERTGKVRTIANRREKTVAQVILHLLTQRGVVAIPKSVHSERIVENFHIFDIELSSEEMESLAELDRKVSSFFDHRDPAIVSRIAGRRLEI